jgi:hypothetical protein
VTSNKVWVRIGLAMLFLLAGAGAWAAMNVTALRANLAARHLRSATNDDDRSRAADRLLALGDPGLVRLVEFVRAGNEPCRAAAIGAIDRRLASLDVGDKWAVAASDRLLGVCAGADSAGHRAVLTLLPQLMKHGGSAKFRDTVAGGLKHSDAAARVLAVRLAMHPELGMRPDVVPLLDDSSAEVRCAALIAVATAGDMETLVADEDLFRWLHDPDESVRKICLGALVGRSRTELEIRFGRRLTSPDPRERLKLLLDLRYEDELADPEPWLERLGRDIEPAVRAGAARAAVELTGDRRQSCPPWVGRIADTDPDGTVRRVARYYRAIPLQNAAGGIRHTGGP